jgi:hypothetical protein
MSETCKERGFIARTGERLWTYARSFRAGEMAPRTGERPVGANPKILGGSCLPNSHWNQGADPYLSFSVAESAPP